MKKLLTVLAASSLVVLGACAGDQTAENSAAMDTTTVQEAPAPAAVPMDSMAMPTDSTAPAAAPDTTM